MKSLARSYLWWPGLDADIESLTKSCLPCLSVQPSPPKSPLNPWIWPSKPVLLIIFSHVGTLCPCISKFVTHFKNLIGHYCISKTQ